MARDLSAQPGIVMTFATGSASQSGASGVVLNEALDDTLTVTFAGVDSAPVAIQALVSDDDPPACSGGSTTTTTSSPPPTSTTTPETTTTTVAASTTTTTTLPPGCRSDAECDDGNTCTADTCTLAGCDHVVVAGLDGAECLLSAALAVPLCPAGTISPKLEAFATAKLRRALDLLEDAEVATKPRRQQRLLDKAEKTLGKVLRHKPGTTTDDCLATLARWLDDITGALTQPPGFALVRIDS